MPRIPDLFFEAIIYLYPSKASAEAGDKVGGSGFLLSNPSPTTDGIGQIYAVTNRHVVDRAVAEAPLDEKDTTPVIRLNTRTGRTALLPTRYPDWIPHPDGDDVSICLIDIDEDIHRIHYVPRSMILTSSRVAELDIGAGDDVFYLGRFITHEGQQQNEPTIRFGNLAISVPRPIENKFRGIDQESYLVEARSLPGYSGAPVFVYRLLVFDVETAKLEPLMGSPLFLLGVDWGHMAQWTRVMEKDHKTPVPEEWAVATNSGMMGVVPSWKLLEILDLPEVRRMQAESEREWLEERDRSQSSDVTAELDVATDDEGVSEFRRFEGLTRKLLGVSKEELDERRGRSSE